MLVFTSASHKSFCTFAPFLDHLDVDVVAQSEITSIVGGSRSLIVSVLLRQADIVDHAFDFTNTE